MDTIFIQYYNTPMGEIILGDYKHELCLADWKYRKMRSNIDKRIQNGLSARYKSAETDLIRIVKTQMEQYFNQERKTFEIPLKFVGTEFQEKVWLELLNVPYGKSMSYLELAENLGDKNLIRAVASANGANAISIIVPCHRIIGSKGELTGYAGGLKAKRELLKLEKINLQPLQYNLFD